MEAVDYHGYTVYKNGRIVSKSGREVSVHSNRYGFQSVAIYYDGLSRQETVSSILAKCFIVNQKPDYYNAVRHIDGNPANNNLENLEWYHRPKMKKCKVMCVDTRTIYRSYGEAARKNNLSSSAVISNYVTGKQKDPRGFTWKNV